MPFKQGIFPTGGLVIRTDVDPMGLARAARETVRSVDPEQPVEKLMALDAIRDESVGPRRINAMLIGSFSVLALVIACVGLFALLTHSLERRRREIGIRIAVGATPTAVSALVMRDAGVVVVLGLAAGVPAAMAASSLVRSLLYGVTTSDTATMIASGIALIVAAMLAAAVPTVRAARVDPVTALRTE